MSDGSTIRRPRKGYAISLWFLSLMSYPIIGIILINRAAVAYGRLAQIIIGFVILGGFFVFLQCLYRWADKIATQGRAFIRETYRGIYRVKAPPTSKWTWLKENIKNDDYAWEREPWRRDNLIYLHGLNEQWGVVWMAGFRRADVEYVGLKPVSEYDWREFKYDGPAPRAPYHWGLAKAKIPCPFPVNTEGRKIYRWRFPV